MYSIEQTQGFLASPPGLETNRTSTAGEKRARRRGTACPNQESPSQLNKRICLAAEAGSESLLKLVQSKLTQMNLVNLSTALHRLARLETDSCDENSPAPNCLADPRFQSLLATTKSKIFINDGQAKARCLSSIVWAAARLRVHDPMMVKTIGDLALTQFDDFKPFELVILLWSFVRMQSNHTQLFGQASDYILAHIDDYSANCLATAIWSFAKAQKHPCSSFCCKASDAFVKRIEWHSVRQSVNPVALENVMWGLATMQVHPKTRTLNVITEAVLELLDDFKAHEFTITIWAFARLGECPEHLFVAAAQLVQNSPRLRNNMHGQGIANLFWAFAKYAEKSSGNVATFNKVVTCLLPTCLRLLPDLKPLELGCVLTSLSKLGKQWGEDTQLDRVFTWVAQKAFSGENDSCTSELSLTSVINILRAYSRLLLSPHGVLEPYNTLVSKLLCMLPRFQSQFDKLTVLSILEAVPHMWTWAPQVQLALANVTSVVTRIIATFSLQELARLAGAATVLPAELRDHVVSHIAQQLLNQPLEYLTPDEFAKVTAMCGLEPLRTDPCSLGLALRAMAWENYSSVQTSTAASESDAEEALRVGEQDISAFEGLLAGPAVLSVVKELSGINEMDGSSAYVTFEINSPAAYAVYNVMVECYHEQYMYDTFNFVVEAGYTIPNTQHLHLRDLLPGKHEVRFAVTSEDGVAQGEQVVHRFMYKSSIGEPVKVCEENIVGLDAFDWLFVELGEKEPAPVNVDSLSSVNNKRWRSTSFGSDEPAKVTQTSLSVNEAFWQNHSGSTSSGSIGSADVYDEQSESN